MRSHLLTLINIEHHISFQRVHFSAYKKQYNWEIRHMKENAQMSMKCVEQTIGTR